jgi:hypothetical protein
MNENVEFLVSAPETLRNEAVGGVLGPASHSEGISDRRFG